VDLGDEEGGPLPATRYNSSLLKEAVYAIGRARGRLSSERALHGAAQGRRGPARNLMCALRKNTAAPRARGLKLVKKITRYDSRSRHVCSLPGAVIQMLSQSLHLQGRLEFGGGRLVSVLAQRDQGRLI
jgi:hypothetical protein